MTKISATNYVYDAWLWIPQHIFDITDRDRFPADRRAPHSPDFSTLMGIKCWHNAMKRWEGNRQLFDEEWPAFGEELERKIILWRLANGG